METKTENKKKTATLKPKDEPQGQKELFTQSGVSTWCRRGKHIYSPKDLYGTDLKAVALVP